MTSPKWAGSPGGYAGATMNVFTNQTLPPFFIGEQVGPINPISLWGYFPVDPTAWPVTFTITPQQPGSPGTITVTQPAITVSVTFVTEQQPNPYLATWLVPLSTSQTAGIPPAANNQWQLVRTDLLQVLGTGFIESLAPPYPLS